MNSFNPTGMTILLVILLYAGLLPVALSTSLLSREKTPRSYLALSGSLVLEAALIVLFGLSLSQALAPAQLEESPFNALAILAAAVGIPIAACITHQALKKFSGAARPPLSCL